MQRLTLSLTALLLFTAAGCTYRPGGYDPLTGRHYGGDLDVMRCGPLDPFCLHGDDDGCERTCCPAPVCVSGPTGTWPGVLPGPAMMPSPVPFGAGVMPQPTFQPPPQPMMSAPQFVPMGQPVPGMPLPGPAGFSPQPTFAAPCPTCGPETGAELSYAAPLPGVPHYPQLFQSPLPAPAAGPPWPHYVAAPPSLPPGQETYYVNPESGEQFQMPSAVPSSQPLPPGYQMLEIPAAPPASEPAALQGAMEPQPTPAITPRPMTPMQTPMQMPPSQPEPQPASPMGTEATPVFYPGVIHDTRRPQLVPLRT